MIDEIKRGYLFIADLDPVRGSEQGGKRPVLILQNDMGNVNSPTVIIAAITSQKKPCQPTHVYLDDIDILPRNSMVLLEQIRTIDKRRLREHMGHLDDQQMIAVNDAIAVSFGLNESPI